MVAIWDDDRNEDFARARRTRVAGAVVKIPAWGL